ncbi:DDE-1 domain-containing protein [Aphis craccivora]|uniref:DDE-1 domain-containing protein n=1 Tax=Aphis craccivora TaxID=307492 RepID=A0A6G0YL89_APHCR|nr:DDE-1 domain-containing protein [Aphis craccivora]
MRDFVMNIKVLKKSQNILTIMLKIGENCKYLMLIFCYIPNSHNMHFLSILIKKNYSSLFFSILLFCFVFIKYWHFLNIMFNIGNSQPKIFNSIKTSYFIRKPNKYTYTNMTYFMPILVYYPSTETLPNVNFINKTKKIHYKKVKELMRNFFGAKFVFLPANSTHLIQPLNVAFFRPLKQVWKTILKEWKKGPGRKEPSVPKSIFPTLLDKLITALKILISGFEKCGIISLNRNKVLSMIPSANTPESSIEYSFVIEDSVLNILKELRYETSPNTRTKRTRVSVEPGRSVGISSSESDNGEDEERVDNPDVVLLDIDAPDIINVDEMNTDSPDNNDPFEINSNKPDSNVQTMPVTIAPNINNTIKTVQNVYDVDILDIDVGVMNLKGNF